MSRQHPDGRRDEQPIPMHGADDRIACLEQHAATLYSLGCRVTGGDHRRAEQLVVDTIRLTPEDTTTVAELATRLIGLAVVDDTSRRRADRLHDDDAATDPELRSFDRWMDDSVLARCRERLVAPDLGANQPNGPRSGHQRPARRGLVAAAVIAVGAVAVVAVGRFGSDRDASDAPPAVAPSAIAPSATAGYVIIEPPDGFAASGAFASSPPDVGGWLQVWAAPDATRTSGDWIALATAGRDVSGRFVLDGAQPTTIAGQPGFVATASDGVQQVSVQLIEGGRVTIAGHGHPAADLIGVATDMVIADGSFGFDAASGLLDAGLELVTSQPSPYGTLSSAAQVGSSWTSTYQSDDLTRRILLSSRPTTPNDLVVAQFILPADDAAQADTALDSRTIDVDGRSIIVSAEPGFDGKTTYTLQWHDGADTISLSGTADLDQLIDAIGSIRPASSAEWQGMESLPPNYYPL